MQRGVEPFHVVLVKPSKYGVSGMVERYRRGFVPNASLMHMRSLTPAEIEGRAIEVTAIDEYVETDLGYLEQLRGKGTMLALVGVQSHQFHRALDLAALARSRGVEHVVIGGPHAMTCDTRALQGRGVSFALAEAELIWHQILTDAIHGGGLADTYGADARWQVELDSPVLQPPSPRELKRHAIPMLGIYPARGCPYRCNFCSVVKIAGHRVRSEPVATTLASLHAAKRAGVKMILFTSDNFNKYEAAPELLRAMIDERIDMPFFVQCDTQVVEQAELVELLGRAGCFQIFLGIESLDRETLKAAHKNQNQPSRYAEIVRLCHANGISSHFSNMFGFPEDSELSIAAHMRALFELDPDAASFYIVTPIPGTEQGDDMRRDGLLTQPNLDRYDATELCWRHPRLDERTLRRFMLDGYTRFYSPRNILRRGREWNARVGTVPPFGLAFYLGVASFHYGAARFGMHPMAGGAWHVRRDHVDEYRALRRQIFDVDQVPYPESLRLPPASEAMNRGMAKSA